MAAEAMYVAERDVLSWTSGCVLTAIKMRCIDMLTLKRNVSGPILVLEILVCFGSLVFAGIQYTRVLVEIPSLVTQLNPGILIVAGIVAGCAGALALMSGLRQIMLRKTISTALAIGLVAAVALFTSALIAIGGPVGITRELILLSVLPILATLHLRYLNSQPALN